MDVDSKGAIWLKRCVVAVLALAGLKLVGDLDMEADEATATIVAETPQRVAALHAGWDR